jgi:hypothetical protein
MVKVISSNNKLGTAQVVIHSFITRGNKQVKVSQTKHLVFDSKDQVWRDKSGDTIKL